MTLLPVHRKAIQQARNQYRQLDSERTTNYAEVHRLTEAGVSANAIAGLLDMSSRQVQRIRGVDAAPTRFYDFDTSEERCKSLERVVDGAIEMACHVRDEDPQLVYKYLDLLDRTALQELTMVLLAGFPMDRTKEDLYGWVMV